MRAEKKVAQDERRIDDAIGRLAEVLGEELPPLTFDAATWGMARRLRIEACKALVPLLERRSKLLGLDAPEQKRPTGADGAEAGSLAELERKLKLVGGGS